MGFGKRDTQMWWRNESPHGGQRKTPVRPRSEGLAPSSCFKLGEGRSQRDPFPVCNRCHRCRGVSACCSLRENVQKQITIQTRLTTVTKEHGPSDKQTLSTNDGERLSFAKSFEVRERLSGGLEVRVHVGKIPPCLSAHVEAMPTKALGKTK